MRHLLPLLLLFGCKKADRDETNGPGETGDTADSGPIWSTLPEDCTAPADLPTDPIVQTGQDQITSATPGSYFIELVDLEWDGDTMYGVGQGGLIVWDVSDPAAPTHLGDARDIADRYHRVEVLGGGYVAVTHRDRGLVILDVSDPADIRPAVGSERPGPGNEGLAAVGDRLYVASRSSGLRVFDVSDPEAMEDLGSVPGLEATWELSPVVDGVTYAADARLGIVPIDLSDPDTPVLHDPVEVEGSLLHVAVDGDWLYASLGSAGVAILDRSDPLAPVEVARVPTSGSAIMASASEGLLALADHEGLTVFDVTDPTDPQPVGREVTEQFALAVVARGTQVWVGDWSILSGWSVDASAVAGELDVASEEVTVPDDGGSVEVRLWNRGGGTLHLTGATVSDDRLTVETSASTLEPGEEGALRLTWTSDGETLDATLCVASDDPDQPTRSLRVRAGFSEPPVGEPAPDFVLEDLDGNSWRLSEQLGSPVLLAYFATW